jgi:hypothetical protein
LLPGDSPRNPIDAAGLAVPVGSADVGFGSWLCKNVLANVILAV